MIELKEEELRQLMQRTASIVSKNSQYIGIEAVNGETKKFLDLDINYYAIFASESRRCADCAFYDKFNKCDSDASIPCVEDFPCVEVAGRYGEDNVYFKKIVKFTTK